MRPSLLNPLFVDVTRLPGVGPRLAALIAKAAGPRVVDVLLTPPPGLIDRSRRPKVAEAAPGDLATLEVTVDRHHPPDVKRRPYRVVCSDETGIITLVFFYARADRLTSLLPEGARRLVSGRIDEFAGGKQMSHPDHIADPADKGSLPLFEAVYPLTAGLTANVMRKAVAGALAAAPDLPEWLDPAWRRANGWPTWREALNALHKPAGAGAANLDAPARRRLAVDELLSNQLALALIRRARKKSAGRAFAFDGRLRAAALAALPYELTGAQRRALADIDADMAGPERMVRLVQGDVGSGKTLVAFVAMLNAVEAGAQAAFMAPTELLARQHLAALGDLARATKVRLEIFTGRDRAGERAEQLARLAEGAIDVAIGTHALFQESVAFRDLGLVVVDEQHRFGVRQRLSLAQKGAKADTLVMTATPIPRTLALTAYGDMDATAIDEKPPGRKPVATRIMPVERLDEVVAGVGRALDKGEQVYWVCPLVNEAEADEADADAAPGLTAAEARFADLARAFGDRVGLVHGKMPPAEKDAAMAAFHAGRLGVLVATTVIEVGVDAPNATAIVIEHAERFGLAQLHQLRGRVGRGGKPGACLLLYKGPLGETSRARLEILRATDDGFRIAEEDLRLRGAGDVLGAAQSGLPRFRFADLAAHADLLKAASDDAKLVLATEPDLDGARGPALRTLLYLFSRDDAVKLLKAG
ncbi:MAG: ATP-dependent DNA helicase RecG [Parvularculaceae bacterium]